MVFLIFALYDYKHGNIIKVRILPQLNSFLFITIRFTKVRLKRIFFLDTSSSILLERIFFVVKNVCPSVIMTKPRTIDLRLSAWIPTFDVKNNYNFYFTMYYFFANFFLPPLKWSTSTSMYLLFQRFTIFINRGCGTGGPRPPIFLTRQSLGEF